MDAAPKAKKKKKKKKQDIVLEPPAQLSELEMETIRDQQQAKLAREYARMESIRLREELHVDEDQLKVLKKRLEKAEAFPDKGVETWFRLASRNLYTRRQIVDSKSNMLVTINSIILSVVLGTVYRELDTDPHLAFAIVPLVVSSLMSIGFAILATKPKLRSGTFSEEDLRSNKANLMTFDDFHGVSGEAFELAVDRIMGNRDLLYGTIKRDIYSLGIELERRYRHVQRAYGVFMLGLAVAAVLFGLCHAMY